MQADKDSFHSQYFFKQLILFQISGKPKSNSIIIVRHQRRLVYITIDELTP